jgi:hypothetical protein
VVIERDRAAPEFRSMKPMFWSDVRSRAARFCTAFSIVLLLLLIMQLGQD